MKPTSVAALAMYGGMISLLFFFGITGIITDPSHMGPVSLVAFISALLFCLMPIVVLITLAEQKAKTAAEKTSD